MISLRRLEDARDIYEQGLQASPGSSELQVCLCLCLTLLTAFVDVMTWHTDDVAYR